MATVRTENPILNSPFDEFTRYFGSSDQWIKVNTTQGLSLQAGTLLRWNGACR